MRDTPLARTIRNREDRRHAVHLAEQARNRKAELVGHDAPLEQQRLRLIPAVGPAAGGGAIPGTRPDHAYIHPRRKRRQA